MKMRIPLPVLLILALTLAACDDDSTSVRAASDQVLAVWDFSSRSGSRAILDTAFAAMQFEDTSVPKGIPMLELARVDVGADAAGTLVEMPRSDDWEQGVELLTNGVDDRVGFRTGSVNGGSSSSSALESVMLDGGLTGEWDPDFAGAKITRLMLRVDICTFDTPGSDPNGDGLWTDVTFEGRILIFGRP